MIRVNANLSINEDEVTLTHTCSAGPGGQNVNKVATRVSLQFDIRDSRALSEHQRTVLLEALATRINKAGVLRISSGRHRTQTANRREVLARFVELLQEALRPKMVRHETKPTRASKERRMVAKSHRGNIKRGRRTPSHDDDF
ncbi:MAG TPA: alternative ribosome rescue aminoacyl-tRNA hydrolase ArfB [Phycisphaerae bacterium]|nr:alternative ribosome rescue aminoacyl-tRNA hydrolase ArfB [Phycisphaerae bacterium]